MGWKVVVAEKEILNPRCVHEGGHDAEVTAVSHAVHKRTASHIPSDQMSMFVSVCQCLSVFVNVCQCLSVFVNVCLCLSVFFNICQCLSITKLLSPVYSFFLSSSPHHLFTIFLWQHPSQHSLSFPLHISLSSPNPPPS